MDIDFQFSVFYYFQNGELKKELHNQQLKITALSEKQVFLVLSS